MIGYFEAIILGIIEGLTEFLPVSSTAHLIIGRYLLSIESSHFSNFLTIFIQLGAISAVPILYFKRLTGNFSIYRFVSISFVPAVVFGLLLDDILESFFEGYVFIAISWILGGVILIKIDYLLRNKIISTIDVNNLTIGQSIKIGFFQCIAMIPGVSRSGATIVGGRMVGLSHQAAVEYSFLLGIPTILGASAKKLLDYRTEIPLFFDSIHFPVIALSFCISFIIALFTIRVMVSFVTKYGFVIFGYYRIFIGVLLSFYLWLK